MSNTEHTPAPWRLDPNDGHLDYWFVDDGIMRPNEPDCDENGPDAIAKVYKGVELGDGLANAHLIVAAPELLNSCKELVELFWSCISDGNGELEGDREAIARARAAIAKAKGETT